MYYFYITIFVLLLLIISISINRKNRSKIEYYRGLTPAFIDLATYGSLDSYLYS
jgi:hypothetical protein